MSMSGEPIHTELWALLSIVDISEKLSECKSPDERNSVVNSFISDMPHQRITEATELLYNRFEDMQDSLIIDSDFDSAAVIA